jgi:hypothetical protein
MRHDPLYLLWEIRCVSQEQSVSLQETLRRDTFSEATILDEKLTCSEKKELRQAEVHRIGDYFERIQIWPAADPASTSFYLLFQRRTDSGRFWKDVMVRVLGIVGHSATDATAKLVYRGDEKPEANLAPRA